MTRGTQPSLCCMKVQSKIRTAVHKQVGESLELNQNQNQTSWCRRCNGMPLKRFPTSPTQSSLIKKRHRVESYRWCRLRGTRSQFALRTRTCLIRQQQVRLENASANDRNAIQGQDERQLCQDASRFRLEGTAQIRACPASIKVAMFRGA